MKRRGWLLLSFSLALAGCGDSVSPKNFVGQWRSSRSSVPIHLHENGEWEIKRDSGEVLQFGVWQYQGGRIVWSFKVDGDMAQEANSVLSVSEKSFSLQEKDQSTTLFERLP